MHGIDARWLIDWQSLVSQMTTLLPLLFTNPDSPYPLLPPSDLSILYRYSYEHLILIDDGRHHCRHDARALA